MLNALPNDDNRLWMIRTPKRSICSICLLHKSSEFLLLINKAVSFLTLILSCAFIANHATACLPIIYKNRGSNQNSFFLFYIFKEGVYEHKILYTKAIRFLWTTTLMLQGYTKFLRVYAKPKKTWDRLTFYYNWKVILNWFKFPCPSCVLLLVFNL